MSIDSHDSEVSLAPREEKNTDPSASRKHQNLTIPLSPDDRTFRKPNHTIHLLRLVEAPQRKSKSDRSALLMPCGFDVWKYIYIIYEQRTKPITSAKGRGWNGHRFLCVPYRSWGFGVRGHEKSKWLKKIEAEAAEEKTAMKMNSFLPARKPFWRSLWGCVCKDSEAKKMVIVRSSFWAAFHFRIFEGCSFCAWY